MKLEPNNQAGDRRGKALVCIWGLSIGLSVLGLVTGCVDGGYVGYYGSDWAGPDYDDYYAPGYYGSVLGPDVYVFGHHDHGGFDRDFGRRGFESRQAGGMFHGGNRGGGFRGGGFRGGGFHGGGGMGHGGGGHGR